MNAEITPACGKPVQHSIVEQILIQSAICRTLPRNAHVIMDNLPQSIMASLLNAAGISYDMVVTEPLLSKYGHKLIDMLSANGIPFSCLGEQDWQLQLVPRVEAGFSGLARMPQMVNVQTVDEAFVGLRKVNWLAMEEASIRFLNSAQQCIAQHRPLISLAYTGNVTSLLQWCELNQYEAVDASLTAVTSDSSAGKYYLFPSDVLLKQVVEYLAANETAELQLGLSLNHQVHKWPALCKSGDALAQLTSDYLTTCSRQYPLATMMATNLYSSEWHDDTEWRWTGPGHDTTILLPMRARGLYRVSLSVLALPEEQECGFVRCFMNGVPVFGQYISAGDTIAFDYVSNKPEEPVELLLSVTDLQNCGGRDLGVAISGIEVVWNLSE